MIRESFPVYVKPSFCEQIRFCIDNIVSAQEIADQNRLDFYTGRLTGLVEWLGDCKSFETEEIISHVKPN